MAAAALAAGALWRHVAAQVLYTDWDRDASLFQIKSLELVNRIFANWNPIGEWLRRLDAVRRTA